MLTVLADITTKHMEFTIDFVTQLNQIDKAHWQRLFASANPFIQYDYLLALEQSQCVSKATGWQPFHVQVTFKSAIHGSTLEAPDTPVALMPMYLKSHSYGEYLFDWSWAQAHEKQGYPYYPKLVSAVPFTPVSGKRLAIAKEYHAYTTEIISAITQALKQIASSLSISNVQLLFHQEDESEALNQFNQLINAQEQPEHKAITDQWHTREDVQFHWFNQAYQSFDDFLSVLSARKRKAIKKERQKVAEQGITFERISGQFATRAMWRQFFIFYQKTYLKRSGHLGYLTLECFLQWADNLPEHITLVIAKQHEQVIAASLFFHDDNTLYGRYWGANEAFDFLHFEACYYQGIELAIDNRLKCFNAGAQGEHKVARGFIPIKTYGHYLFCKTPFAYSIIDYLWHEQKHHQEYRQQMSEKLPYKTNNDM